MLWSELLPAFNLKTVTSFLKRVFDRKIGFRVLNESVKGRVLRFIVKIFVK